MTRAERKALLLPDTTRGPDRLPRPVRRVNDWGCAECSGVDAHFPSCTQNELYLRCCGGFDEKHHVDCVRCVECGRRGHADCAPDSEAVQREDRWCGDE